jgi:hypothetical protein
VDIEKHIKRACLLVYYLLAVDESWDINDTDH